VITSVSVLLALCAVKNSLRFGSRCGRLNLVAHIQRWLNHICNLLSHGADGFVVGIIRISNERLGADNFISANVGCRRELLSEIVLRDEVWRAVVA